MTITVSQLPGTTFTLANTTQVIAGSSSFTLSSFVGFGFRGGTFFAKSNLGIQGGSGADTYGVSSNLRGSTSTSDGWTSNDHNGPYSCSYNNAVSGAMSKPAFSGTSNYVLGVFLANAYYEAATGTVNFVFTNNSAVNHTLHARIAGTLIS